MSELEITFVKVQPKKKGAAPGYLVTIPKREVAEKLGLTGGEKMKVLFDSNRRRIVYELVQNPQVRRNRDS